MERQSRSTKTLSLPGALAVHANSDTSLEKNIRERRAGELAALIRVEDLPPAVPSESAGFWLASCNFPSPSTWSPIDYDFVAQANLRVPLQVDSGRPTEKIAQLLIC